MKFALALAAFAALASQSGVVLAADSPVPAATSTVTVLAAATVPAGWRPRKPPAPASPC